MKQLPEDVAAAAQETLEADLTQYRFTPPAATPPPMSVSQLDELLATFEAGKQQIVCHPDDYERVSAAVDGCGFGLYYVVHMSQLVDPGQALLLPPQRDILAVPPPQFSF